MYPLRDSTPNRRTNVQQFANYRSYREILKQDFNHRCWYCNQREAGKFSRPFCIDHFVPKKPKSPIINPIADNYYNNLVYSCPRCNAKKWNKWPTWNGNIHNNGIVGFVDPTSKDYDNLFYRDKNWKIISSGINDQLAKYIIKEIGLNHSIHIMMRKRDKLESQYKILKEQNIANELFSLYETLLKYDE